MFNSDQYTMKYVSPVAKAAGQSLESMAAAAGVLGNAGIQADSAGTALRMMLIRLARPPKMARDALNELGISVSDSQGRMKDLSVIIGELSEATKDMGEADRLATISKISGVEASAAMLALMDAGQGTIEAFTKELENSGGTAEEIAKKQLDNLKGQLIILKSAIEGAAISIGNALLPALKKVTAGIQKAVDWFNGLNESTKRTIAQSAAITAVLALIAGPLMIVISLIPPFIAGLSALAGLFTATTAIIAAAVAAIAALGAAFVWLYKNVDWFRRGADYVFGKMKQSLIGLVRIFTVAFEGIKQFFGDLSAFMKAFLNGDWAEAQKLFVILVANAWVSIKKLGRTYLEEIKRVWGKEFKKVAEIAGDMKDAFITKLGEWKDAIVGWFKELPSVIEQQLVAWTIAITTWIAETKLEIAHKLAEWTNAIIGWFQGLPEQIVAALQGWGEAINAWMIEQNAENIRQFGAWKTAIEEWFASIPIVFAQKLAEWWTAISTWFAEIPVKMAQAFVGWTTAIITWYNETKTAIIEKFVEWNTAMFEWFNSRPGEILKWLATWWLAFAKWMSGIPKLISAKLEEWWTAFKTWFKSLPEKPEVKNAGRNMIDKVAKGTKEKQPEFMDKLGKLIVDVITGALMFAGIALVAAGREIVKRIIAGIKEIDLKETGANIVRGLISGMGSMLREVKSKAEEIAAAAAAATKSFLRIKSPSRVMMQLGVFTGQGFANGIGSMIDMVRRASSDMADAAVPELASSYSLPSVNGAGMAAGFSGDPAITSQTVNFERMFEGATFNVRSDADIKSVARELYTLQESAKRRKGVR